MNNANKVYSVSEVNYFAKQTLEQISLWVEGEISSIQQDKKWFNAFITIKDEQNTLPCFIEKEAFEKFDSLKVGDRIQIYGMLTLFRKSEYKLKIFRLKQSGEGILQKKFEKLYKDLKNEGLFDLKHKKEIPVYPKKVCIISSQNSAAWNDFKTHTVDKFSLIELFTADISVEGISAVGELVKVLGKIDTKKFDIVVVTRGGGSQESLMEVFNNEKVIRSIFSMKTPTIVAVGHEINITLSELVADKRASTPTDAANMVSSGYLKADAI